MRKFIPILFLLTGLAQADLIPRIDSDKSIYMPTEDVGLTLSIDADQVHENVVVEVTVEREVSPPILIFSETMTFEEGVTEIPVSWPLVGDNNNVHGHLATVTLRDDQQLTLARDDVIFDIVDDWTKVMRLAAWSGADMASPGPPASASIFRSDASIASTTKRLKFLNFNTFEAFHYADPYNMNMDGLDIWPNIDRPHRLISRDRLVEWGKALHRRGMIWLAYNEMLSITGPDEWKLRNKYSGKVWCSYYCDIEKEGKEYFVPNANFIAARWGDEIVAAVDNFDFDGTFMDGGTGLGRVAIEQSKDWEYQKIPGTVGGFQADFQKVATARLKTHRPNFGWIQSNIWHVLSKTKIADIPLDDVYDHIKGYIDSREMLKLSEEISLYSIEWDSAHRPSDRYPQTYEEMTVYLSSASDLLNRTILQWGFLSGQHSTVAYVRPKMAMYLAAGLTISDHQNFYWGPMRWTMRDKPANRLINQYRRFWARYGYYTTNPARKLIRDPKFVIESTQPLFWKRGVRQLLKDGKREITINVLNLPSNGLIQGQQEIPPVAHKAMLGIDLSLGLYDVWSLDADNPELTPRLLEPIRIDDSYWYELPPVVAWQVLVLKESATPVLNRSRDKIEEVYLDLGEYLKNN